MDTFPSPGKIYTDEDWNPATYEEGKDKNKSPSYIYCKPPTGKLSLSVHRTNTNDDDAQLGASKKLAEKAAWDFIEEKKPHFALTTILPPMVFGPPLQPIKSLDSLNTSSQGQLSSPLQALI
jgi:nucleoside-diphosphate-sugar epimerase